MRFALHILLTLLILQGLFSFVEGIRFNRFVRRSLRTYSGPYTPKVVVVMPCKGAEVALETNIRRLFRQNYPDYEIIFVIATRDDGARPIIEKIIADNPQKKALLMIAGISQQRSEKVNNLLNAVSALSENCEAIAFTDSDAEAGTDWLLRLVSSLDRPAVGACSGYRWYLPLTGGFWPAMLSAWNGSVATGLGDHRRNFAWGGATAILKRVFDGTGVAKLWEHALSDDYALTQAVNNAGYHIAFVPGCLMVSRTDCGLASLLEFTTRQVIITRVYRPRLWLMAFISHLLFCLVFFGGLLITVSWWLGEGYTWYPPVALGVIYALGSAKGFVRLAAARTALPLHRSEIARTWWMFCLSWPLVSLLFLYNFTRSAFTRRIKWRGVWYELRSSRETVVIKREQAT